MAGNTAERVRSLVEGPINELGLTVWDVRYVKEGASWYLRIYIDKPEGISIDDCTNVSHLIDPILDEADPIDASYYLEVCSPGLNRELRSEAHYRAFIGSPVTVTLYKAEEGNKTFTGILSGFENGPVLDIDGTTKAFTLASVAKAVLCDDEQACK